VQVAFGKAYGRLQQALAQAQQQHNSSDGTGREQQQQQQVQFEHRRDADNDDKDELSLDAGNNSEWGALGRLMNCQQALQRPGDAAAARGQQTGGGLKHGVPRQQQQQHMQRRAAAASAATATGGQQDGGGQKRDVAQQQQQHMQRRAAAAGAAASVGTASAALLGAAAGSASQQPTMQLGTGSGVGKKRQAPHGQHPAGSLLEASRQREAQEAAAAAAAALQQRRQAYDVAAPTSMQLGTAGTTSNMQQVPRWQDPALTRLLASRCMEAQAAAADAADAELQQPQQQQLQPSGRSSAAAGNAPGVAVGPAALTELAAYMHAHANQLLPQASQDNVGCSWVRGRLGQQQLNVQQQQQCYHLACLTRASSAQPLQLARKQPRPQS
jgi:hypothetical protein